MADTSSSSSGSHGGHATDLSVLPSAGLDASILVGVGCALVLVGEPLAWMARASLGGGKSPLFSATLLLFGILLILSIPSLRRGRFWAHISEMAPVLIPLLCILVLSFARVSDFDFMFGAELHGFAGRDTRMLIDTVVLLLFTVAIYSQPLSRFERVTASITVIGALAATMSVLYAISSAGTFAAFLLTGRLGGFGEGEQGSAPFTIAKLGALTAVAAVIWYRERSHASTAKASVIAWAVIVGLLLLLFARARTVMLGLGFLAACAFVLHLLQSRIFPKRNNPHARGITRLGLAVSVVSLFGLGELLVGHFDQLSKLTNQMFTVITAGAGTLLGHASIDASAVLRRAAFQTTFANVNVFGHGVKARYTDDPVLSAYYDLGLVGGTIFVFVAILLPLKICLDLCTRRQQLPPAVQLAIGFYFISIPNFFLLLTPYAPQNWYPIIFFYAIAGRYWNAPAGSMQPSVIA